MEKSLCSFFFSRREVFVTEDEEEGMGPLKGEVGRKGTCVNKDLIQVRGTKH